MSKTIPGLSGYIAVRNALKLDYCVDLAVESLVPICEEVIVGDMMSDDGTRTLLHELVQKYPNVRMVDMHDWTKERGNHKWWVSALNECRSHIKGRMQITLDADEILSDDDETYRIIKEACEKTNAVAFNRLNFAGTAHELIPEGECCGKYVVRLGPAHLYMPSDEPHNRGELHILDMAAIHPTALIFHLGFMRKRGAFFQKARVVLGAFFNDYDSRLRIAEEEGTHPFEKFPWWNRLVAYNGYYPDAVRSWLSARGYEV